MAEHKKINPFKNISEKQLWLSNNCEICKKYGCASRRKLKHGSITIETAEIIGYNNKLNNKCNRFTVVSFDPNSNRYIKDNFQLNMF